MERLGKKTEVLTDLMQINRECSETVRLYISEYSEQPETQQIAQRLARLCIDCITELRLRIDPTYGDPADAVTLKGMIYRSWVHNDDIYFSRATPELFHNCKQKARSIKHAYEKALKENLEELTEDICLMLRTHLDRVNATFDYINSYQTQRVNYPVSA